MYIKSLYGNTLCLFCMRHHSRSRINGWEDTLLGSFWLSLKYFEIVQPEIGLLLQIDIFPFLCLWNYYVSRVSRKASKMGQGADTWQKLSQWKWKNFEGTYLAVFCLFFSHSVMSDSLRPHESQHARHSCPSPTPGVHSDSCPLSQWCHRAMSCSVVPFSSCPQSLPASESFPMSQLFAWGGQSIGVSALASILPKNTQDWSPLGWTGWISLQSKGL